MPRTQNFSCPTYRNFPRTVGRPTDDDRSTATSVRIWATFTIPSLRERTLASSRGSRVGHDREHPFSQDLQTFLQSDPRLVAEDLVGLSGVAAEPPDLEVVLRTLDVKGSGVDPLADHASNQSR